MTDPLIPHPLIPHPLTPRLRLSGIPHRPGGAITPNGSHLAWVAPLAAA